MISLLSFIYGAAGCGKTREIYRRAAEDARCGRRAYILVPEQYSMYTEQELLSGMGLSAQNRIQVLTFSRLCNMVFAKCGPLRMKYIDKAGKYMTAHKALKMCEPRLTYLRPNVHQRGFAASAAAAFSEFKRYGVTPDALLDAAEKTDNARLGMKLRDLSLIFRSYNEVTCENHSDSEDNLSLIIPKISRCDFISGTFYINFFRSFTPEEHRAVSELMKKADVCVALCCDSPDGDSAPFSSQKKTYRALCAAAAELGIAVSAPVRIDNSDRTRFTDELLHIRDSYFAPRPEAMTKKPESIHIVRPANRYAEVTECASLITRLLRGGGLRFNDFLIVTGGMESYEQLIPQIFGDFGISFFLDKKLPLTESPFMRMIITVLEILAYGFSCERVMTLARCGYFDISDDLCDIFENYVLAADVGHRQWNMRENWTYNPDRKMFDMEAVNEAKDRLVTPVLDFADMFRGRKTVAQVCEYLRRWLISIGMPETVSQRIDRFNASAQPELAEQLRLVWNCLASVTEQMTEYMGDDLTTFAEFHTLFASSCGELAVGMIPPTRDAVMVSEADRFRSTGTKIVIVLGVCDKAFPREHTSEGIISDAERAYLAENGLVLAPDAPGRQLEEQFVIYSVLTAAREQLWLFAPMSDRDGKSLGASEVTERLREKLFRGLEAERLEEGEIPESREYIFRELSRQMLACSGDPEKLSPLWQYALGRFEKNADYIGRLERLRKMCGMSAAPAPLTKKCAERLYGKPLVLSVSRLEKYNACAFSFFMQYGLMARERMLGGFQARDMGTALHDVLCEYFRGKAESDADYGGITREECSAEVSALVDRIAYDGGEALFAQSCYSKYLALRMKSIAAATAWKLVRFYSQSRFRPCGFEISFGRHGSLPPYQLTDEDGGVFLEGFIDRADEMCADGHRYICITDYKSSEKKLDRALAEAGISFQPLIYANALCSSDSGTEPAAMIYLHMTDPLIKCDSVPSEEELEKEMNDGIRAHGIILDEPNVLHGIDERYGDKSAVHYMACDSKSVICREEMKSRLENAERKAAETAKEISDGRICADPAHLSGFDACTYCPYESVCGKETK